jgi:hypothetical protein
MRHNVKKLLIITCLPICVVTVCNNTTNEKISSWQDSEKVDIYTFPNSGGRTNDGLSIYKNGEPYKTIETNGLHIPCGVDDGNIYTFPHPGGRRSDGLTIYKNGELYMEIPTDESHYLAGIDNGNIYSLPESESQGGNGVTIYRNGLPHIRFQTIRPLYAAQVDKGDIYTVYNLGTSIGEPYTLSVLKNGAVYKTIRTKDEHYVIGVKNGSIYTVLRDIHRNNGMSIYKMGEPYTEIETNGMHVFVGLD